MNPGSFSARDVIARIARMCAERGAKLVVDEVYGDYAAAGGRPGTASQLSPNIIAISSLTKIYGLSTLRCGWIIASDELLGLKGAVSSRRPKADKSPAQLRLESATHGLTDAQLRLLYRLAESFHPSAGE